MAISKQQPMRPALDDTIDFLNENLDIQGIEAGIGSLGARIAALEDDIKIGFPAPIIPKEPTNLTVGHRFQYFNLPDGVNFEDIVLVLGSPYVSDPGPNASPDGIVNDLYRTDIRNYYQTPDNPRQLTIHWYTAAPVTFNLAKWGLYSIVFYRKGN